jgi:hypothetical protein
VVFPYEQNFLIEMKHTLLSLALILFGLGSAYGQTTLDLQLNVIPSSDIAMFEVNIFFSVLPDSMGTGNEMGSGWEMYDPQYTFTMLPAGTLTTEYYWEESITYLSMFAAVICGEDSTILPPINFQSNTPTDIVYVASLDVGCGGGDGGGGDGGGDGEWDCPNLMSNIGDPCQGDWGVIDENCDCVYNAQNCFEGIDTGLLLLYASMECGNPDNPDAWWYCGLLESIAAASAGDEEACSDVWAWIEANDWDGSWDPGNGGNDVDCPNLGGNIGDWCTTANGGFGEISSDCECIEIPDCDLVVETNLLSIDDGTGSGSVEAIASGGTPPYAYVWMNFFDEVLGTNATLDSVQAGSYFIQVTDANGCIAFGWEDVPTAWDCPELEANVGDFCGNGDLLQIVSEDCECVEYEEPNACVADFTVVQAYDDNEVIPFELFVFIWGYDENNTYSWDFGDEGTSSDPFPSWTYGGSGPYNLCLTVSNEEEDCAATSCQLLEIDSLGWINGFMDGFSITIMNGEDGVVNGIDEQPANELGFNVMPNPVINGSFVLNWEASSTGLVEITMLSMDGSVVVQTTRNRGETNNAHSINVAHLAPGLYLCQVRQNGSIRTEKVVIR